jgi:selenocysteine lyase/cysteine desulfurase
VQQRADEEARGRKVHDLMRRAEVQMMAPLLDYLASRNDLRLIGPRNAADRAPTLAVALDIAAAPVAAALADHGIAASGGDFYAVRPIEAMGIDRAQGVLRLSAVH